LAFLHIFALCKFSQPRGAFWIVIFNALKKKGGWDMR